MGEKGRDPTAETVTDTVEEVEDGEITGRELRVIVKSMTVRWTTSLMILTPRLISVLRSGAYLAMTRENTDMKMTLMTGQWRTINFPVLCAKRQEVPGLEEWKIWKRKGGRKKIGRGR